VESIGGAVLQGGGSTALAILLLAMSDAYTFRTFFKIFTIVVIFGLYYGVVFLPVLLSIFKPRSYSSVINESTDEHETQAVLLENFPKKIEIVKNSDRDSNSCDSNENMKLQTT
jgi:Patched family